MKVYNKHDYKKLIMNNHLISNKTQIMFCATHPIQQNIYDNYLECITIWQQICGESLKS